jgi:hypothetical protein
VSGTGNAVARMLAASASSNPMISAQYITTDRYLASFLHFRGAALEGLRRLGPKKIEFRFRADPRLHELLRLYWSGQLTPIVPSLLFQSLQKLKSLSLERN